MPTLKFLTLDGDPNQSQLFQSCCEALFSVSYKIKFLIKKSEMAIDYGVMPLEGLWWIDNGEFNLHDKDNWRWTLMVRQPDFVTDQHIAEAKSVVQKKKKLTNLDNLTFQQFDEGLAIQILHMGPYAEEQPTIDQLHRYIGEDSLQFNGKYHEVYLNDPTKTAPGKLKTIIRQPIKYWILLNYYQVAISDQSDKLIKW